MAIELIGVEREKVSPSARFGFLLTPFKYSCLYNPAPSCSTTHTMSIYAQLPDGKEDDYIYFGKYKEKDINIKDKLRELLKLGMAEGVDVHSIIDLKEFIS